VGIAAVGWAPGAPPAVVAVVPPPAAGALAAEANALFATPIIPRIPRPTVTAPVAHGTAVFCAVIPLESPAMRQASSFPVELLTNVISTVASLISDGRVVRKVCKSYE
jgi:hypothetical protein